MRPVVLARAGFPRPERLRVPAEKVVQRSVEDVSAWVYSRSDSVQKR